jgi:hypothetical protein
MSLCSKTLGRGHVFLWGLVTSPYIPVIGGGGGGMYSCGAWLPVLTSQSAYPHRSPLEVHLWSIRLLSGPEVPTESHGVVL